MQMSLANDSVQNPYFMFGMVTRKMWRRKLKRLRFNLFRLKRLRNKLVVSELLDLLRRF